MLDAMPQGTWQTCCVQYRRSNTYEAGRGMVTWAIGRSEETPPFCAQLSITVLE
jgi:hypothetical protein